MIVKESFSRTAKTKNRCKTQKLIYVDRVDATFTTQKEAGSSNHVNTEADWRKVKTPVKRSDFSMLGERSKLVAAMPLTTHEPNTDEFNKFPLEDTV